jgi:uncharacterized membrane protein
VITLALVYIIAGLMFAAFSLLSLRDSGNTKRYGNAGFWGLLAVSFLFGDHFSDAGNGALVLGLVAIAGTGQMGATSFATTGAEERKREATRRGHWLFGPALIVPVIALAGTICFGRWPGLVDPKQATLIALALGVIIALGVAHIWLKPSPIVALEEGRRLIDAVGWAAVLPQMLASLGAVFALAGVGETVGALAGHAIPEGSRIGAVLVYGLGMAFFTVIMGNAFAAFPVMTAAIGIPLLIKGFGADPAVVASLGMLCGFCGTLMTPMAANFNIVPAALLELKDRNAVIRAQVPTAIPLLAVNILLLAWLAF